MQWPELPEYTGFWAALGLLSVWVWRFITHDRHLTRIDERLDMHMKESALDRARTEKQFKLISDQLESLRIETRTRHEG